MTCHPERSEGSPNPRNNLITTKLLTINQMQSFKLKGEFWRLRLAVLTVVRSAWILSDEDLLIGNHLSVKFTKDTEY